jgi:hypothetical protein
LSHKEEKISFRTSNFCFLASQVDKFSSCSTREVWNLRFSLQQAMLLLLSLVAIWLGEGEALLELKNSIVSANKGLAKWVAKLCTHRTMHAKGEERSDYLSACTFEGKAKKLLS